MADWSSTAPNYPICWPVQATDVDKILKSTEASGLPVEQPTKFDW